MTAQSDAQLDVSKVLQSAPDGISVATGVASETTRKRAFLVITLSHEMSTYYDKDKRSTCATLSEGTVDGESKIQAVHKALSVDHLGTLSPDQVLAIAEEYRKQVGG